jgi:hypothetical protein
MTKLTQRQQEALEQAAKAEGDMIDAASIPTSTAKTLIQRGLMISVPQNGGSSRLLITKAGRTALGLPAEPASASTPKGKVGVLIDLLRQPEGATIDTMMAATGWQAHSVRGAISGTIKKAKGLAVASAMTEAGRIYRIVEGAGA